MKNEILKILEKYKDVAIEFGGENVAVHEEDFEIVVDEIMEVLTKK